MEQRQLLPVRSYPCTDAMHDSGLVLYARVKRVAAFKGGISCPCSHHKRVVVVMAGLTAGHKPTTSEHSCIGRSGGLQGPVQSATPPPQVSGAFYG